MRRRFRKILIVVAALGALTIAWVIAARPLSLFLDRIHTVEFESQPVGQIALELGGGLLRINDLPMSVAAPNYRPYPMEIKVSRTGTFVVQSANRAIALGQAAVAEDGGSIVKPEMGDKATWRVERSMLSWPTPLAMNFMTGHSPSWKRNIYYRLVWEKPTGARLEMLWRYEQYYYDDWASGFMTRADTTGLIRVDIRP